MTGAGIAFLLGVCGLLQLTQLPSSTLLLVLLPFALLGLGWRRSRYLALGLCGFLWAGLQAGYRLADELPAALEGVDVMATGRVIGIPEIEARQTRFLFAIDAVAEYPDLDLGLVKLAWYQQPPAIMSGERWQLQLRMKRPHGFYNPGGFDFEAWLFAQGIRATGYVRAGDNQRLDAAPAWHLDGIRAALSRYLRSDSFQQGGLLAGLAVGDRQGIDADHWQDLSVTGTNHLLAISGLHISLSALLGYWLCAGLWRLLPGLQRLCPRQILAAWGGFCLAVLYAALAGFAIPAQRALIMLTVVLLAMISRRRFAPWSILSAALLAVVVIDSTAVLSAGFWLSFIAVAMLWYLGAGRLQQFKGIKALSRIQLALSLALLPVTLWFFQRGSLVGPLANLVAIPWVSMLVVPLTLLGSVLAAVVSPNHNPLLYVADQALDLLMWTLHYLASSPWAQYRQAIAGEVALFYAIAGILLLLAPAAFPGRYLGLLLLFPLMFKLPPRPEFGRFAVYVLDVGQGLSTVVVTAEHVLVYDTGAKFSEDFDAGEAVVEPFLRQLAFRHIDTLVISHGDNDHRGGYASLAASMSIDQLLTSVPEKFPADSASSCQRGQFWDWDGVHFEVLHPADMTARGNNASCVLRVSTGGHALLLPGDIESAAENALLRSGADLRADVLLAPHHGSKTSSTEKWLAAVAPHYVVFPVGYRNRYKFPHETVVARYQAVKAHSYQTAATGMLQFEFDPIAGVGEPQAYRQTTQRLWHSHQD